MGFFNRSLRKAFGTRAGKSATRVLGLGALLLLAGCATTEFYQARDACRAEWYARIPERIDQRIVNETRYEERFTGETICTTNNNQRDGSVCLNSFRAFCKWISASVMPPPPGAQAG